jgi:hypothetical protein
MTKCASSRSLQDAVPTYLRSEQSCVLNSKTTNTTRQAALNMDVRSLPKVAISKEDIKIASKNALML